MKTRLKANMYIFFQKLLAKWGNSFIGEKVNISVFFYIKKCAGNDGLFCYRLRHTKTVKVTTVKYKPKPCMFVKQYATLRNLLSGLHG